jgi:hypothetical protein
VERPFKAAMPAFVPAFVRMHSAASKQSRARQRAVCVRLKIVAARKETKI